MLQHTTHDDTDHRSLIIATQSVTVTLDCHVSVVPTTALLPHFTVSRLSAVHFSVRSTRTGWFHLYDSVYKLKRRDLVGDEEESLP